MTFLSEGYVQGGTQIEDGAQVLTGVKARHGILYTGVE
jgi:hypothetical protein